MIEIEKKFLLTDAQQQALLDGSRELGQKTVEDSYLDTDDYQLTTQDYWFRLRDGAYELKAPLRSISELNSATNRYHELTTVEEICQELDLNSTGDFNSTLSIAGIKRFMTCLTNRTSYEKQGFHIDIDTATYLDSHFEYAVAEIELLVNDESEADEAERRIIEFAKKFDLTTDRVVLGKVAAYLKAESTGHYDALVKAGVLK